MMRDTVVTRIPTDINIRTTESSEACVKHRSGIAQDHKWNEEGEKYQKFQKQDQGS